MTSVAGNLPILLMEWSMGETRRNVLITDGVLGFAISTAISALCWTILPVCSPRILRLPFAKKWIALISLLTAIALAGTFIGLAGCTAASVVAPSSFEEVYFHVARTSVLITIGFSLSVLFHEILNERLNTATLALKEKDLAEERLRQVATEARLSSLESRVRPHFLFNTLNSISALIREDPAEAERMLQHLSSLLRFSLHSNAERLIPLEKELTIVKSYLEIEQVRFGARLHYTIEVDPELRFVQVPPFSIQTLVENSVKYAVSTRREGAEITIRASLREGKPAIDVLDNGPGFSLADLKSGHGLDLLQSRLGPDSALEIGREPQLTRVTVLI